MKRKYSLSPEMKVIVNSTLRGARKKIVETTLRGQFADGKMSVEETSYPRHATEIAKRAVKDGVETIVAVGGDGTINETLNGVVGSSVTLGVIPAGTGNDLASHYGIPANLQAACATIRRRVVHIPDLINVNGWHYITAGGIGLCSNVAEVSNAFKQRCTIGALATRVLRSRLYVLATLWVLLKEGVRSTVLKIRRDGRAVEIDTVALFVTNQSYLGSYFRVSPSAVNDDGWFDVCLIERPSSFAGLLSVFRQLISGEHERLPFVHTWRARELGIQSDRPVQFFGDGEVSEPGNDWEVRIVPNSLNLIVPYGVKGE